MHIHLSRRKEISKIGIGSVNTGPPNKRRPGSPAYVIHVSKLGRPQVLKICNLSAMHLSRRPGVPSVCIGTVWWSTKNLWTKPNIVSRHFVFILIFLHHQQLPSTNSSVAFLLNLNRPRDSRCCDSWDMRDEDGKCYFATLQMNEECYCQPEPA